jgi:regulator of RNase E activity RraA
METEAVLDEIYDLVSSMQEVNLGESTIEPYDNGSKLKGNVRTVSVRA